MLALLAGGLGLATNGCGANTPTGDGGRPTPTSFLSYYGVGQYLAGAAALDYLPYIQDQYAYSNFIALSFGFTDAGALVAPTPAYLAAVQRFEKSAVMLGKDVWFLPFEERQRLFQSLKSMAGYQFIDIIIIIDEPYLGGFTPADLQDIISEGKETFPDKEYAVNFNPREFADKLQGPNGRLFDEMLNYVSFDMYPGNFDVPCTNETRWKQEVNQDIDFFQGRTTKPLIYIGQGFSRTGCPLTADMISWTYEATNTQRLFGLVYWFAEDLPPPLTGFTSTPLAEQRVKDLGARVIQR